MLLTTLTAAADLAAAADIQPHTDVLAQVGPSGVEAPPGADKYQTLMNIVLWVVAGGLACVGVAAGLKFAIGYQDGTNSRGQQMALGGVAIGAVFSGTATALVNTLMF
ncbi:hypothetical protein BH93_27460 (plasmid) [Rhodococcoides fascians A25f]|uniref:hypothetical protein n=1 Tax=Rhodococcoides fascians TaxID=1828 RepID=UPI000569A696|nr:hypothetical protein [Rhodococcus fascians]QII09310.1 hypothetical protein BH93_27460 [Rhodococcus fascians A25f]